MGLVLQQLNKSSLANTAMTCSKLRDAAPANISELVVYCSNEEVFRSFSLWLERNRTSLSSVRLCRLFGGEEYQPTLRSLHISPSLMQLELRDVVLHGPSEDHPGVLHDCTGLTSLSLDFYEVLDSTTTAAAAIAALPQLRHLELAYRSAYDEGEPLFADAQLPLQLSHLSLDGSNFQDGDGEWQPPNCNPLSSLVNLERLDLKNLPAEGIPGGIPSQLSKLTCLDISDMSSAGAAEQFQHLSSLTALQQLSVECYRCDAGHLSGIAELSQLSSLALSRMQLNTSNTHSWTHLPALQKLALTHCAVQPDALKAFTQLRALSLDLAQYPHGSSLTDLLGAVSKLTLLTELLVQPRIAEPLADDVAAAFTALTASTNLHTLKVGMPFKDSPEGFSVFKPGAAVYPHLRVLDLRYANNGGGAPFGAQQLQQLCSCCPAAEVLSMSRNKDAAPAAWAAVQQLTALTLLAVSDMVQQRQQWSAQQHS
jgi:hypothetical protein